jgi:hypothetical protein
MTISSQQVYAGLSCVGTTSSTRVSGTLQIGTSQRRTELATTDVGYAVIAHLTASGNTFTMDVQAGTYSGTAETQATVLINPTGADNSIDWTAVAGWGYQGNATTITYAAPVALQATTLCAAVGQAITVTPGAKARMIVTGTLNPDATGTQLYAGVHGGYASYTHDGAAYVIGRASQKAIYYDTDHWALEMTDSGGSVTYLASTASSTAATPEGLTFTPSTGTGTPTVAAAASSAAQVIAAGIADAATALLAVPVANGTVTGAVAAVTATNLATGTGTIITGTSGKDFEGTAIPSLTTLSAINIEVVQGSATVTNGTNIFPIPALIYGATTGTLLTADLVFTATANDTIIQVTVLGVD